MNTGPHASGNGVSEGSGGGAGQPRDLPSPIIAPEGLPIVAAFLVGSGVLSALALWLLGPWGWSVVGVTGLLTLWCIWFFRDPKRALPGPVDGKTPVISPADGVICFVGPCVPPSELGMTEEETRGMVRVSVFMNVFNVHVNRAPLAGTVVKTAYRPGKFFNASFDKASEHNERHGLVIRTTEGVKLACVQIAGLVARRIVCRVKEGDVLAAGQRYGLIRFGSRVDVYLPAGIDPLVRKGEKSVAGETVFAWTPPGGTGLKPEARVGSARPESVGEGH